MAIELEEDTQPLLCSSCFVDQGLRIDSEKYGLDLPGECPNCKSVDGRKLSKKHLLGLADRFFVSGTIVRCQYGAAPVIQFNECHYGKSDITSSSWLKNDIKLIEEAAKVGFFHYGPRLWMVGEVEPLKELQAQATRPQIIKRVLSEYPVKTLAKDELFYRLRVNPSRPAEPEEYDSPPVSLAGRGRLDSTGFPVMYGSQDIDICVHECRVAIEDDIYIASLRPNTDMRLLDLTEFIEDSTTEFESLDIAIHMLFLAGTHSYEIARDLALAAKKGGFDGVIYPSYFSLLRTGARPFETIYGLSIRRFPTTAEYAKSQVIPNFALFGRPVEAESVRVDCINRLVLTQVGYRAHFGPVCY